MTIEAKWVEIDEKAAKRSGLDWLLRTGATLTTNQVSPTASNRAGMVVTNSIVGTVTGILTDRQFREVLRELERRAGVDILSAPKVTTLSGRQTHVSITDPVLASKMEELGEALTNLVKTALPQFASNSLPLGPTIAVTPWVLQNGTIHLINTSTIIEFLGYVSFHR